MRKRVDIRDILEEVNKRNRESTCSRDMRIGWNCLLESLLHSAGVYSGFLYLDASKVPAGELPGIVWRYTETAEPIPYAEFPDDSRREYQLHTKLVLR